MLNKCVPHNDISVNDGRRGADNPTSHKKNIVTKSKEAKKPDRSAKDGAAKD
jgi:hypothetical protein